MQESAVWQALRREVGTNVRIKRVENGKIDPGFPDTVWTYKGKTGLFELKDYEGADWVSKEQAIWMRDWASYGGICGILAKKTRSFWLWFPARPSFEWMRSIQTKTGLAPAITMSCITQAFFDALRPTNDLLRDETLIDPRQSDRVNS